MEIRKRRKSPVGKAFTALLGAAGFVRSTIASFLSPRARPRRALAGRADARSAECRESGDAADHRLEREKMRVLGRLVPGMAHEVANPIQNILAIGEQMKGSLAKRRDESDAAEDLARLERIVEQTERIGRVVHAFSDFASPAATEMEPTSVNLAIEAALHLVRLDRRFRGATFCADLSRDVPMVRGVANQLTHAAIEVLMHAAGSMQDPTGSIHISSRREGDAALVAVERLDESACSGAGGGASGPIDFAKTFDSAPDRRLAVCGAIVERHGGSLATERRPAHGTRIVIRIPIMEGAGSR